MKKRYAIAIVFFLFLFAFVFGWCSGSNYTRHRYERDLTEARELAECRGAELAEFMGESERRARAIRAGLDKSLELSIRAADRSKRIRILVEAIDRAIEELDTSTRDGDREEYKAR